MVESLPKVAENHTQNTRIFAVANFFVEFELLSNDSFSVSHMHDSAEKEFGFVVDPTGSPNA